MSSRIQQALVKQLARQIRNQTRRENKLLHTALRHKIQQHKLVEEHFADREYDALQKFDMYYQKIKDSIEINKTRFDLSVDERIDRIFENHHRPVQILAFDNAEFQEATDRMFKSSNNALFFKNLYSSTGRTLGNSQNNDVFYALVACSVVIAELFKLIH